MAASEALIVTELVPLPAIWPTPMPPLTLVKRLTVPWAAVMVRVTPCPLGSEGSLTESDVTVSVPLVCSNCVPEGPVTDIGPATKSDAGTDLVLVARSVT